MSDEALFEELARVAEIFKYVEFTREDYNKFGNISSSTIERRFSNWKSAQKRLREYLQDKGLSLSTRLHRKFTYSDKELFDEMGRVWQIYGQRPSRDEWLASDAKISSGTYERRFGSWINACLKFVEYKMGGEILEEDLKQNRESEKTLNKNTKENQNIESRSIPLSVRLQVLNRDSFRCVFCGKSPATDLGAKLHIDHIHPFSKGGKAVIENLQTLCQECNMGKSDKENISTPIRVP